jgi:hypothetical protein
LHAIYPVSLIRDSGTVQPSFWHEVRAKMNYHPHGTFLLGLLEQVRRSWRYSLFAVSG